MTSYISCTRTGLIVFLLGFTLSIQGEPWGQTWPNNRQEKTIEEIGSEVEPEKSDIKIKDVNEKQQFLLNNKPKMIEKTKILKRVRNLKDKGIEKTKVIYRTRVIGLFNPKSLTDINNLNNLFEWPTESEENDDFSSMTNEDDKNDKKLGLNDIDTLKTSQHNEMPKDKHSSKKELRNNFAPVTFRSVEDVNNNHLKGDKTLTDLNTVETFDSNMKKPINTFRKVHFVDSLELYKNEQLKKQQVTNDIKSFNRPRPILQRQYSFYRHLNNNNNNINNNEVKNTESSTSKTLFNDPSNTIILLPSRNINNNINNREHGIQTNFPLSERLIRQQAESFANTVRPDWIGNLLIRKVAEAQLAQKNAAQSHIQTIHQYNSQQQAQAQLKPKPEQQPNPEPQPEPKPEPQPQPEETFKETTQNKPQILNLAPNLFNAAAAA